jgi:hypothetical protein
MKKVAILQSNYIPWKGYFDMIAAVDEFILYDDVQFTKNDWRNRNRIKTHSGVQWLTVPVGQDINRLIREVELKDTHWQKKHWATICHSYKRAPHFLAVASQLEPLYLQNEYTHLSQLNRKLIEFACQQLGIKTKISNSWDYALIGGQTAKLINLCEQAGASEYISGPAARDYLDENLFESKRIKLTWFEYANYPEYPQLWGKFEHAVSILDLLFNCGDNAPIYMKYARL